MRLAAAAGSWRGLPALYRENAVFVTASAGEAREQLACGARVIGPLGSGLDADAVRAELDKARTATPLSLTEIRGELRDVFISHATPARLTAIARAAGVPAGLVGGRQIAVLEAVTSAEHARKLAAALLAQRLRPAEVVAAIGAVNATEAASVRDALGTLTDHGIRVVTTGEAATAAAADPDWARPLARLASAPWLALWDQARAAALADSYLLDLACARECSQADAVGFGTGDYEFTSWLDQPPASSAVTCWCRKARRRATGAATGCGCSRSPGNAMHAQGATPTVSGTRPGALVYADVDMNLLDGSAIWLQSMTQALVAAGCAVTLVLKAQVRTDRLIAPLRDVEAVTIRSPHAEQLLPGLTDASLTVAQAVAVLAAVDADRRHDLVVLRGRALVSAAARDGAFDGRPGPT